MTRTASVIDSTTAKPALAVYIFEAADNHGAIRAYEKVGFRKVGAMHSYERGSNGT